MAAKLPVAKTSSSTKIRAADAAKRVNDSRMCKKAKFKKLKRMKKKDLKMHESLVEVDVDQYRKYSLSPDYLDKNYIA